VKYVFKVVHLLGSFSGGRSLDCVCVPVAPTHPANADLGEDVSDGIFALSVTKPLPVTLSPLGGQPAGGDPVCIRREPD